MGTSGMPERQRTLEEFEQRYQDMVGFTPSKIAERLKLGMKVDPNLLAALEDWRIAALTPKALDQKTVQLICFAILLAQTSEAAANHARAAIRVGVTPEELHAAAGLATLFRGLAAFNLAGEIIAKLCPDSA